MELGGVAAKKGESWRKEKEKEKMSGSCWGREGANFLPFGL